MAEIEASGPNAEQIKYWNERGTTWVQLQEMLDQQLRSLGEVAMDRAQIAAGERVLDVGCGCGQTTRMLANRVGGQGSVVGVDISIPMLERARAAAREAGIEHVRFENADAQTHPFAPPPFDLVFSRFGVMFFADPPVAFANLRAHLRPGGRLAFVCWQSLFDNQWMLAPLMAAAALITLPTPPPPGSPGPFALADPDHVRGILEKAGFTDIQLEDLRLALTIAAGGSIEQATDFLVQMGPVAQLTRDSDPELLVQVRAAIADSLKGYETPRGIEMPSACWVVTARNPVG